MAIYSDVTRESVLAAIRECDDKGRDEFLAEHGYRRAKSYLLVVDGREYDSKAILGVACGYEHPDAEPLPYNAFPGGRNTVEKHFRSLGFEVRVHSETAPRDPMQARRTARRVLKRAKKGTDGRVGRRQTHRAGLRWSEWCAHDDVIHSEDAVLNRIGVYRFRFADEDGNPIVQSRFLGVDSSGVVYIGRSQVPLGKRLRRIPHSRETGKSAHTLGLKLHVLDGLPTFRAWSRKLTLECQYAHSPDPVETEKELIRAYVATYGEIPPLNGEFPNRGDRVAWSEYME